MPGMPKFTKTPPEVIAAFDAGLAYADTLPPKAPQKPAAKKK